VYVLRDVWQRTELRPVMCPCACEVRVRG
jgi:hypothetical protein